MHDDSPACPATRDRAAPPPMPGSAAEQADEVVVVPNTTGPTRPTSAPASEQSPVPASVIVLAQPLATFDHSGVRNEVYSCAYNLLARLSDRRFYYLPSMRIAITAVTDEDDYRQSSPDARMVPLLGGYFKVSLMTEFDPPEIKQLAIAALRAALPGHEFAQLKESNVRPLPVAKVGWRIVDPLPLDELGVVFYHSCVPTLTSGCQFPLEVMVSNAQRAVQMKERFAELTLMARLSFAARSISKPVADTSVAAYRAAVREAAASGTTADSSHTVTIRTRHLLSSQAWRTFLKSVSPGNTAPGKKSPLLKKLRPPGAGQRVLIKSEPNDSDNNNNSCAQTSAKPASCCFGLFTGERTTFFGQLDRLAVDFRREIGSQPTLRMLDGSVAAGKFEELTAKYLHSSAGRRVLWDNPLPVRPSDDASDRPGSEDDRVCHLGTEPCCVQGVNVCQAEMERVLNRVFTPLDVTGSGETVYRCQVATTPESSEASGWLVWGFDLSSAQDRDLSPIELQQKLLDRCGVTVDFLGGRIVPVKLEVAVLSLIGLMPNRRERNIGCLHTTPTGPAPASFAVAGTAAATKQGPIFPDDGRRMHREVQLTNPVANDSRAGKRGRYAAETVGGNEEEEDDNSANEEGTSAKRRKVVKEEEEEGMECEEEKAPRKRRSHEMSIVAELEALTEDVKRLEKRQHELIRLLQLGRHQGLDASPPRKLSKEPGFA